MILSIQLSTAGHPRTPRQTAKFVLKGVLQTGITVAASLVELVKTLPSTLKINMAPKTARYSGDKAEGSKTTHTGKDKGESIGAVRRPIATAAKLSRKNTTSVVKDSKNDDGITPSIEVRGKGKIQPTIISNLAAGAQENCTEHNAPLPANSQSSIEVVPLGTNREGAPIETNKPFIRASQSDILDSGVVTKRKRDGSPISRIGHSAQRSEIPAKRGAAGDVDDTTTTTTTLGTEGWQHLSSKLMAGDKEIEKILKPPDWAKDGVYKLHSLTEESDITSSEHDLNETGSSKSSETGDISSSKEPTVRQQQRHRNTQKCGLGPARASNLLCLLTIRHSNGISQGLD
ncbi:hypothetical protein NDU88_007216 [Pleurodeles waltl]|uniref:Uncharacterized protein n=1 Tax=Pleurodeles waltl TaxID=8319 RepID=A0AAV7URQ2_PLEWA|nr:hypothetical protein NDU88_007216 [Pleurodeles waltl]